MVSSSNVTYTEHTKETIKTLQGLAKSALREAGKETRKILRQNVPIRSKRFKNHIATWAFIDKRTGQPTLQVGFYSAAQVRKKNKKPSHANPHWLEFGTNAHTISSNKVMAYNGDIFGKEVNHGGTPALHVLRNTVYDNIDIIRKAQEKYLGELSKELSLAQNKIIDSEEVEDD